MSLVYKIELADGTRWVTYKVCTLLFPPLPPPPLFLFLEKSHRKLTNASGKNSDTKPDMPPALTNGGNRDPGRAIT